MFWRRNFGSFRCQCVPLCCCLCEPCRCCECCCNCSCNCNCGCHGCVRPRGEAGQGSSLKTYYYKVRELDMPMTTYYGEGYTEVDCCVSTNETLRDISDTLKAHR